MTPEELIQLVRNQNQLGLSVMVLTMPAPKSWKRSMRHPLRVRTPFGLCRWNHGNSEDRIVIYVEVEQALEFLRKPGAA